MFKKYFAIIILLLLIILYSSNVIKSFTFPIARLIYNLKEGNFSLNENLNKYDIELQIKKYIWSYDMNIKNDRIIVNFTGPIINKGRYKFQMADMHIFKDAIPKDLFFKISKANMGECTQKTTEIRKNNGNIVYFTICKRKANTFVHYDIPSKQIMITYYPYSDNNKEEMEDFFKAIVLKE